MSESTSNLASSDFREGLTSAEARDAFDAIAHRMECIVKIIADNPQGLTGTVLAEVGLMARLAGLEADSTAGDVRADLNAAWGVRFVACEVEAQALAAIAIDKARGA